MQDKRFCIWYQNIKCNFFMGEIIKIGKDVKIKDIIASLDGKHY